jgi:hypothetical protein
MKKNILIVIGLTLSAILLMGITFKVKDDRSLTSFAFQTGQVTCSTAGTAYPIPVEAEGLSIKALSTNTGKIYVGNATTATSSAGYELTAGQSTSVGGEGFYVAANTIYVTSSVNGEKVCWARLY